MAPDRLKALGERYRPMYVSGIGSMFKIHFSEAPSRYRDTSRQHSHSHRLVPLRLKSMFSEAPVLLSVPIGDGSLGYLGVVEEFLAVRRAGRSGEAQRR
jgi:hypothetical protein